LSIDPSKIVYGLVALLFSITKSRLEELLFEPSITILLPVILKTGAEAATAEIEVVTPGAGLIVKVVVELEQLICGMLIGKDGSAVLVYVPESNKVTLPESPFNVRSLTAAEILA
jgi:hypothetical protein